jgi:hypothetical protein
MVPGLQGGKMSASEQGESHTSVLCSAFIVKCLEFLVTRAFVR